jgi:hypothetical protein
LGVVWAWSGAGLGTALAQVFPDGWMWQKKIQQKQ